MGGVAPAAALGDGALRPSRCCRSSNGATTPSRTTSSSPSSTAGKDSAAAISGNAALTSSPLREKMAPAGAPGTPPRELHADAVPFPFRGEIRRDRGCEARLRPAAAPASSAGRPAASPAAGRRRAPLQPVEQRRDRAAPGRARPPRSLATGTPPQAAIAVFASRAETPTRRPPVISLSSAKRPRASSASSQPSSSAGTSSRARRRQRLHHLGRGWAPSATALRPTPARSAPPSRRGRRHSRRRGQTAADRPGFRPAPVSAPAWRAASTSSPVSAARPKPRSGSGVRRQPVLDQRAAWRCAAGRKTSASSRVGEALHRTADLSRARRLRSRPATAPRRAAVRARVMDQRLLATVRHQHHRRPHLVDGLRQLVPVGVIGDHQRQLDAALPRPLADAHPARGEAGHRLGKARAQRSAMADGGHSTISPASCLRAAPAAGRSSPSATPVPA